MPPQDRTPLGDAMNHRFPEQKIPEPKPNATMPEVPAPDTYPPVQSPDEDNPNQKRDDRDKPQAPPADDEPGRRYIPIDLPGREHAPERVK